MYFINKKGKHTILLLRIFELVQIIGLFCFLLIGFNLITVIGMFKGIIWISMVIPIIIMIIIFEWIINYKVIIGITTISGGFILHYKRKTIEIQYTDILSRKNKSINSINAIVYKTNMDNSLSFFHKNGEFISFFVDDEAFNKIDEYFDI